MVTTQLREKEHSALVTPPVTEVALLLMLPGLTQWEEAPRERSF